MDDVISLISTEVEADELLIEDVTESSREVYCTVKSVSAKELADSRSTDLIPAYQFTVFAGDYESENILEYHGERFSVYRTYMKSADQIELYAGRKAGV